SARSRCNLVRGSPCLVHLSAKSQAVEQPSRALIFENVEQAKRGHHPGKRACGECHTDEKGKDLTVDSTSIAKPDLPVIWLKHARFDHAAHDSRGIDCRVCHKDAYPASDRDVAEKEVRAAYDSHRKGAGQVMLEG